MHVKNIDDKGYIYNPCLSNEPMPDLKKAWAAIVFRQGKKIKIASFLPKENNGRKIGISGLLRGVYIVFCAITEHGETRLLYIVEKVTKHQISLLPTEEYAVPDFYNIDCMTPTKTYMLEAKLTMVEAQLDELRTLLADLKNQPLDSHRR